VGVDFVGAVVFGRHLEPKARDLHQCTSGSKTSPSGRGLNS